MCQKGKQAYYPQQANHTGKIIQHILEKVSIYPLKTFFLDTAPSRERPDFFAHTLHQLPGIVTLTKSFAAIHSCPYGPSMSPTAAYMFIEGPCIDLHKFTFHLQSHWLFPANPAISVVVTWIRGLVIPQPVFEP